MISDELTLYQRVGVEPIQNFPWLREAFRVDTKDFGCWIKRPRRRCSMEYHELRGLQKPDRDWNPPVDDDSFSYVVAGDCPLEAVLPGSFQPKTPAIPAYPTHQMLSWLWRWGVRLTVTDQAITFHESVHISPSRQIGDVSYSFVRAVLGRLDIEAVKMWIQSYWDAPPNVRWRWYPQAKRQRVSVVSLESVRPNVVPQTP